MFDAGLIWNRLGHHENSSDPTSWNWVDRKREVFAIAAESDDHVDSLLENGVKPYLSCTQAFINCRGPADLLT
jgi:hypothetical protein